MRTGGSKAVRTALTDLFKIQHPVLLAPMGTVAGGRLVAAVGEAGGLGLLGGGYGDAGWLRRELALCDTAPFGVGFITWSLAKDPALLDLVLERAPAAVMFSFGDFEPFLPKVRAAGAKVVCQVQTVAQARRAAASGADVIVAQGAEAGGHGGGRATFTLVPAVVDAVGPIPVVAAGGIADGRGLAAALALGAAGAMVGTRFFATHEALGHETAKARIAGAEGDRTVRTRVFDIVRGYPWPEQFTGRALLNDFATRWHGREGALWSELDDEKERYAAAAASGDVDTAVVFAGEDVDLIRSVEPAGEVVRRIVAEAEAALDRARA